ncbi:MAG: hypothetical protein WC447_02485 [Candidatus Paceibacterota bacterium]|jgi:hypothetical protein
MRNILIFLAFFSFLGVSCLAQNKYEPLETKMFFQSREEAEKAFLSGEFRYYQPNPKNLVARPPKSSKGLPCPYVVLEEVRESKAGSPAWVILASATLAVFNFDGIPLIDGRCRNRIFEAHPLPLPAGKDGYTPIKGIDYFDGKDGRNGRDGRIIEKESSWMQYVVGIALLGGIIYLMSNRNAGNNTQNVIYIPPVISTPPSEDFPENTSGGGTIPPN